MWGQHKLYTIITEAQLLQWYNTVCEKHQSIIKLHLSYATPKRL
jgi:hypothetical protein